ncbi:MAG: HDOD domain-containing protein [Gammaproteobacteria bacterium]
MDTLKQISLKIHNIRNLPPLPQSSCKILEAVNDPDISLNRLAMVISTSPSLVARLLGLANSAYFGQVRGIKTLREAIIRVLGLSLVRSLVLSIILNIELNTRRCKNFDTELFWSNSLLTAILAQKFSTVINVIAKPEEAYTAGLLLNIGLLTSVHLYPEEINSVLECVKDGNPVTDEIENQLGISHYKVGSLLLNHWRLPEVYQIILREMANRNYNGEYKKFIALSTESHRISRHLYRFREYESLLTRNALSTIGLSQIDYEATLAEVTGKLDDICDLARAINRS